MGTTAEKLNKVLETKEAIRTAINNKGGTLTETDTFDSYPTAIDNLTGEDTSGTKFYKYEPKGGTAIPNNGTTISKIYLNINFTSVDGYLKSLGLTLYEMNGFKFYPFLFDSATYNAYLIDENGAIQIINFVDQTQYEYWFDGSWKSNVINQNGIIEFSTPITSISEFMGIPIGVENEKIKSIISFDNSFNGAEKVKCSNEDILSGNVAEVESDITSIRYGAFAEYKYLKKVNLPNVNFIGNNAFRNCQSLQNISLPLIEEIGADAFLFSMLIESAYLPKIKDLGNGGDAFASCNSLKAVIIEQTEKICNLYATNAFDSCSHFTGKVDTIFNPNGDKDGFVYVPDSLVEQYKVDPLWSNIASQIKPLSELPQEYKDLYNIE